MTTPRDPAVEAAQHAWSAEGWGGELELSEGHLAIAAAREALNPLRELHQAFADYYRHRDDPFSAGARHVLRDFAELIYTDDELTGGDS